VRLKVEGGRGNKGEGGDWGGGIGSEEERSAGHRAQSEGGVAAGEMRGGCMASNIRHSGS
jgi:hypothetical protein